MHLLRDWKGEFSPLGVGTSYIPLVRHKVCIFGSSPIWLEKRCHKTILARRSADGRRQISADFKIGGFEISFNCLSIDTLLGKVLYRNGHYFQKIALLRKAVLPNCRKMNLMLH